MVWVFAILKFIFGAASFFGVFLFVLICITSVTSPEFETVDGVTVNKNQKAAIVVSIITAVLLGIFFVIP